MTLIPITSNSQGSAPTGPAGGFLSGNYPNPDADLSMSLSASPADAPLGDGFYGYLFATDSGAGSTGFIEFATDDAANPFLDIELNGPSGLNAFVLAQTLGVAASPSAQASLGSVGESGVKSILHSETFPPADSPNSQIVFELDGESGQHVEFSAMTNPTSNVATSIADALLSIQDANADTTFGVHLFVEPDDQREYYAEMGSTGAGTGFTAARHHDDLADSITFYGGTPVAQAAAISAPSGGAVTDTQARAAIVAILNVLGAAAGGVGLTA